jgi:hypothetical protein
MNWEDLLSSIRIDLQDTSGTPRWTDEYLFLIACDGVRDYSTWFPKRIDRYQLTLENVGYPLPDNLVEVISVECPLDSMLEERRDRPGVRQFFSRTYYLEGGNLYMNFPPQDDVYLTYYASREVPEDEDDTDFEFDLPIMDYELIRLYVKAQVHVQMRAKQSRLDRFTPGSGRRDDNPLTPETANLLQEYYDKIAQRLSGGVVKLYRTGRTR